MKKEKSHLSVWYWGATTRYYLRHPLKWFKELFANIRNAHDRITKGYCSIDWYNFDHWFTAVAPEMLRDMADHGFGYPGHDPFETREDWSKWLHKIANQLDRCNEDWCYRNNVNEYQEDYMKIPMRNVISRSFTPEEEELRQKYFMRELDISKENDELIKETLNEMSQYWYDLWD